MRPYRDNHVLCCHSSGHARALLFAGVQKRLRSKGEEIAAEQPPAGVYAPRKGTCARGPPIPVDVITVSLRMRQHPLSWRNFR